MKAHIEQWESKNLSAEGVLELLIEQNKDDPLLLRRLKNIRFAHIQRLEAAEEQTIRALRRLENDLMMKVSI